MARDFASEDQLPRDVEAEKRYVDGLPAFGIYILPPSAPRHQEDVVRLLTSALVCAEAGKIEEVSLTVRYTDGRVDTMWSKVQDHGRMAAEMIKAALQCLGFNPDKD